MSGGTAIMLMMKAGVLKPSRLVSLRKLQLEKLEVASGGALSVGAMTTLRALEKSDVVRKGWPVITKTLRTLSNVRVRNVATLGGHLAHGDPHMDLPPVLIALGASVTVVSPKGERTLTVEDLLIGYYETALEKNELIASVTIPPQGSRRAAYIKFTAGSAEDWPALGVAVSVEAAGDTLRSATVVASAATTKATRLASAEAALKGARIDDKALKAAGDAGAAEADVLSDVRGSAAYKRELIRVHVGRAIRQALAGNGAH
jgi:carbon-monoxide dehydrogenase medium subunit